MDVETSYSSHFRSPIVLSAFRLGTAEIKSLLVGVSEPTNQL